MMAVSYIYIYIKILTITMHCTVTTKMKGAIISIKMRSGDDMTDDAEITGVTSWALVLEVL